MGLSDMPPADEEDRATLDVLQLSHPRPIVCYSFPEPSHILQECSFVPVTKFPAEAGLETLQ